jgi:hypothetical protein
MIIKSDETSKYSNLSHILACRVRRQLREQLTRMTVIGTSLTQVQYIRATRRDGEL